jgi:hypothetical protein
VIALYSYVGEDCYGTVIDGKYFEVCSPDDVSGPSAQEAWQQVRMSDGATAWVEFREGGLVTRGDLDSELGEVIANRKTPLQDKLAQVDVLVKEGANLNGDGGQHGFSPAEVVIGTADVVLLKEMLSRGLDLRKSCAALQASNCALDAGGEVMLQALFDNGMRLDCLRESPLRTFILSRVGSDAYPVERAIRVAEVLASHGVAVNQRNREGRSVTDELDDPRWAFRLGPLRSALARMAATER